MQSYSSLTDMELTALMSGGDHAAFTEIYNRYWALLYRHASKMLEDKDQGMDIVQDIFADIWNRGSALKLTGNLKSYLYTSVRNKIVNILDRGKLNAAFVEKMARSSTELIPYTDQQVSYREFEQLIEQEIANLPPKMRAIFNRSRNSDLSHKAIAEELDISEHTVKTTVHRALNTLRTKLAGFLSMLF